MSINLNTAEAVTRDKRLKTVTFYHDSASNIRSRTKDGSIKDGTNYFSQCSDCSQMCAEGLTYLVRDAAVVIHSPIGCVNSASYNSTDMGYAREHGLEESGVHCICTNIEEKDTVYGGVKKIEDAIREAQKRFSPNCIFVQSSCASGIIGDDIESVADMLQEELGIPVIPVYCEGFKSRIWASGFDAVFHGVLRKLVHKPDRKDPDLVNIFTFAGIDSIRPLLKKLNLTANILMPFVTTKELAKMSEAACSTQICESLGTYVGLALEEQYGVPRLNAPAPYGIKWTDEWLRAIGEITDRQELTEQVIESEHERIREELALLRKELGGKKIYIYCGNTYAVNLASMAADLGMEISGITTLHNEGIVDAGVEEGTILDKLIDDFGDVERFSICNRQPYIIYKLLQDAKPDVLVVRHFSLATLGAKLGIPSINSDDANVHFGYDGVINLGHNILDAIKAKRFFKTVAAHAEFPYTDWWLQQEDPFYFEKEAR